jgi:hypothetical protein
MRRVDINARSPRRADGIDEVWLVNPLARSSDPAGVDSGTLTGANVRECLVAMPGSSGDLATRVSAARITGAPAVVRICPGPQGHGYPLASWAVSPIPEYCEREDLALFIDFGERADYPWTEVVAFARAYPRLAVVALGAPLRGPTAALAFDATANLILDTTGLTDAADLPALALLARECGAYRLAYASGEAGIAPREIAAALPGADAEMILAATAARLDKGTWGSEFL